MRDSVLVLVMSCFVGYCLGWFVRPIGDFYVTLLIGVGRVCLGLANWLQAFSVRTVPAPGGRPGLGVIVRLIALFFALLVMAGEAFSSLVATPALFGTDLGPVQVPFPNLAAPALGVLFFALCSIFGIVGLEAAGCLPAEARLFEVPQVRARAFRWFAFGSLAVSLMATALFYAERKFYLLNPTGDITMVMQTVVFMMLGVLVPLAAVIAIWMLAVGMQAVVGLVLGVIAFAASVTADVCQFLARHFRRGTTAVDEMPLIRRPGAWVEEEEGDKVLPHSVQIGEAQMHEKKVAFIYGGPLGSQYCPVMERTMRRLGADRLVASAGVVNVYAQRGAVSVGVDVSPWEERGALLAAVSDEEQPYEEQAYRQLFDRLGARLIDAHGSARGEPSALFFFLDANVLASAAEMLRKVHHQLASHTIAVVTQLDDASRRSETVRKGLRTLVELHEEGVIATSLVISSRSRFALTARHTGGAVKQMEFVAQSLSSLLLGDRHSTLNPSCVEVLRALGGESPFVGCAFASGRLSPTTVESASVKGAWAALWRVTVVGQAQRLQAMRAFGQIFWASATRREVGDQENIRKEAEQITRAVLTDPECRASVDEALQEDLPAIVIYNVPIPLEDRRFGQLQTALRQFLGRRFPLTASLMVRANGIPLHIVADPLDRYYVQASCLYPLDPAAVMAGRLGPVGRQEQVPLPLPTGEVLEEEPRSVPSPDAANGQHN